jgi:hypothetical protein
MEEPQSDSNSPNKRNLSPKKEDREKEPEARGGSLLPPLPPAKKLSPHQLQELNAHLYSDHMRTQREKRDQLERRYYPRQNAITLSPEQLRISAQRQVNEEINRRKANIEGLVAKYYKPQHSCVQLPKDQIEESVRRIYDGSKEKKSQSLQKLEERYTFRLPPVKKLSGEDAKACGERLSKPQKRSFSLDEINAILGFN